MYIYVGDYYDYYTEDHGQMMKLEYKEEKKKKKKKSRKKLVVSWLLAHTARQGQSDDNDLTIGGESSSVYSSS